MNSSEQAIGIAAPAIRAAGTAQGLMLVFASALPAMAIVSLVPNLPQLLQRFGSTPHAQFLVPMIITLPSLCIALFSPVAGALVDFGGRRRLLLASLALFSVGGVLPYLLDDLSAILVTRFFIGIAEATVLASQNALMGDYFAGSSRQRWLGRMSVIMPFIATVLVLAGGYLGSLSWRAPFLLYFLGLPMLVWAALVIWEPASPIGRERLQSPVRFPWRATALVGTVTIGIAVLYYVQGIQLGRMFAEHGIDSPAKIGMFVTLASLGVAAGGWGFSRLAMVSVSRRFALILLSYGIGYGGLGLAPSVMSTIPFAVIAQFGNGLAIPALLGWALGKYDFTQRGRGMGIWGAAFFIGTFLSPPAVTLLSTLTGRDFLPTVAIVGAGCLLLAAVVFVANPGAHPTIETRTPAA